jgi:putative resolvase
MKLSTWAKKHGFTYKGAHNLFQRGQIPGAYQLGSGTILIEEKVPETQNVVVYFRVSNR